MQSQFSLFLCILKPEAYAQKLDRSKTPAQLHIMNRHPDVVVVFVVVVVVVVFVVVIVVAVVASGAFATKTSHLRTLFGSSVCVCTICIDVKLLYCAGGQQPIFLCCPTKLRKMWWMGSWTHEPVPAFYRRKFRSQTSDNMDR